jgi:uncharacterized protein YeaO (DUF488 family)
MFKIKHFLDAPEPDDGQRIWVEPIGLTNDLREMCQVGHLLSHVGPPVSLWEWFEKHPDGYDYFRGQYHDWLTRSPHREGLQGLVLLAQKENITLLHQGDDAAHNTATALYEYLSELEAYLQPE